MSHGRRRIAQIRKTFFCFENSMRDTSMKFEEITTNNSFAVLVQRRAFQFIEKYLE